MAAYANSHFNFFTTDKGIKDSILTENPISSNLIEVKLLEEFMAHLLKLVKCQFVHQALILTKC